MARGGGTGSRATKKKKADAGTAAPAQQNGVDRENKNVSDADKHQTTQKHRKQKEDTPPVIQQQPEEEQAQKDAGREKLVPTSEQLRLAQIIQSADSNKDPQRKAKINQIMEITGKTEDDVATALFDTDWDETKAIELLLEGGMGGWEETGKKKTKKSDKDDTSRENEDFNDDFDPTSDNRDRSRGGRGGSRLRGSNRGRPSDRGDNDWKHREHQENERNFEGGRGRGRGMGPRGRGGHAGGFGMDRGGPRTRGGRGGAPRGGGPGPRPGEGGGIGEIDTWNPMGSEKPQDQAQPPHPRMRNSKDAFDNAGNWGDDFPAAEDWDNDEYTGSLADSKVFTPSGTSSAKAVGEPVNGQAPGQAPANNSMSYSQPIDLSSLLKTGGLREYNAAASQDLKTAIGIGSGGGKPGQSGESLSPGGGHYSGPSLSYSSGQQQSERAAFNTAAPGAPGSAFSPIKPAAVTNGSADRGKALPRARLPPPSKIPHSAVEMPGAGGDGALSNLDVQFGGMDLQFGGGGGSSSSAGGNDLDFNAAPGKGLSSSTTPSKDISYVHSIQSSGGKDDSYKGSPASLAPGAVKPDVNQSLSSLSGLKSGSADSAGVPGYGRSADQSGQSRSSDKFGASSSQRSPGPLLTKSDNNLGYGSSQSSYPYQSSGGGGKSGYNSYSGSGQGYDRQNSSGYSGSNGLNSSYGAGSGDRSNSYNSSQSGSGYSSNNTGFNSSSQQGNNFSSSYGAVTTAGGYSSFSSSSSYSAKSSTAGSSYLPTASTGSLYTNSSDTVTSSASSSSVSGSKSSYDSVSAAGSGLGLSSVSSSSKMSVNTTQGSKLVPGMPPGVGVLPAQYMTPTGFPAYLAAGLGQPAAAMYGYGGHQLEDLAALQRNTLAASLPAQLPSSGYYDPSSQFGGSSAAGAGGTATSGPSARDGQNSFSENKFTGSDSTSSPVPSTVGSNSVGQQPAAPFNLASSFTAAAAAQHPTLPPGYAYFYGGVGGMPGLQYGGVGAGGGVYPGPHTGIPVPTAAGNTSTSQQFQNKPYGSSYGTTYDSLSLGQSSSGYVNNKYGSDSNQGKAGSSAGGGGYWSNALW